MKLLLTLAAAAAVAAPPPAAVSPLRREVVVLYNSAERVGLRGEGSPTAVELVLNYMGLVARFHDLSRGLPDPALTNRARAIISLAEGNSAPNARGLAVWLDGRRKAHQPILLLGGLPFLIDARTSTPTPSTVWRPLLDGLGLHYDGDYLGDPARIALAGVGPGGKFEIPWAANDLPPFIQARVRPPARSLLQLRRRDTGAVTDMAVVGPAGAVVLGRECLFDVNPLSYRVRWRMDPFMLLGEGLSTAGEPKPDVTTINGRRAFYAHVDGDGFTNLALAKGQPFAAEVLRDKLLSQTPLPTSVSVIARDIVGDARASAVARSIFALPNVEAATHTYNHPHDFERGTLTPRGQVADGDRISGIRPKQPLSPTREIDDSVNAINELLPDGKRVEAVFWPGSTNPTPPFLARVKALGLANLNGGDAMVDPLTPSVANLSPYGRQVGPYWQVYASAANENLFTNLWNGPYDGQRQVLSTYAFSGSPRRLAAVDLYYHFYSGERPASLKALEEVYSWAEDQPFAYVFASRYARSVEGFYAAQIAREKANVWRAGNMGLCRTLRFDHQDLVPDLGASSGVAGYSRTGDALYVHLTGPSARVVLGRSPAPRPYLAEAGAPLASWKAAPGSISAAFDAAGPCEVVLAGLPAGHLVKVGPGWRGSHLPDARGRLTLSASAGHRALEVRW